MINFKFPKIAIRGFDNNNEIRNCIKDIMIKLNIDNSYDFNSPQKAYIITYNAERVCYQISMVNSNILINTSYLIVEPKEYYEQLSKYYDEIISEFPWYQLKVGDIVTINHKRIHDQNDDYPCFFADEMEAFSGSQATITEIYGNSLTSEDKTKKYYNFDDRTYRLDVDSRDFMWHSSMFTPISLEPVKDISLVDLSIISKLF